jgi:hypothetical protein
MHACVHAHERAVRRPGAAVLHSAVCDHATPCPLASGADLRRVDGRVCGGIRCVHCIPTAQVPLPIPRVDPSGTTTTRLACVYWEHGLCVGAWCSPPKGVMWGMRLSGDLHVFYAPTPPLHAVVAAALPVLAMFAARACCSHHVHALSAFSSGDYAARAVL